jgi:hypothetical protein
MHVGGVTCLGVDHGKHAARIGPAGTTRSVPVFTNPIRAHNRKAAPRRWARTRPKLEAITTVATSPSRMFPVPRLVI